MEAANKNIVEIYIGLLNSLNPDSKLELISRLSQSLINKKFHKEESIQELFGAFKSEKSAETIIEELRQSRNVTRHIEEL